MVTTIFVLSVLALGAASSYFGWFKFLDNKKVKPKNSPETQKRTYKNKPFKYEIDIWLYFVNVIACNFIILLSLGIAMPWAICKYGRFHASKSSIDGKSLVFNGNPKELLPYWLSMLLLSILTFGIYAILAGPKLIKWYWENFDFKE